MGLHRRGCGNPCRLQQRWRDVRQRDSFIHVLAREPVSPLRDVTLEMIREALPGAAWTRELILNFASARSLDDDVRR